MRKKIYKAYDPDLYLFTSIIIIGSLLVSGFLLVHNVVFSDLQTNYSFAQALRYGSYQAISAQTSTGFATANYDLWSFPSQLFMLILMFIGGMAGSTCGGIKTSRYLILFKVMYHKLESIFRPDVIRSVKCGDRFIDPKTQSTVLTFFCIALLFTVFGVICLVLNGLYLRLC